MGRPREPTQNLSKWGLWKRASRDSGSAGKRGTCSKCGKNNVELQRHHTDNSYGRKSAHTIGVCRGCHNALRARANG